MELLRACLQPTSSPGSIGVLDHLRRRAKRGLLDPLHVLSIALCKWPTRRLIALTLSVLPAVLDDALIPTPQGCVVGCQMDCSASPFIEYCVRSTELRSLHSLLCCVLAHAYACPSEALVTLRVGIDVVRCTAAQLGSSHGITDLVLSKAAADTTLGERAPQHLYELFSVFLHVFLGVVSEHHGADGAVATPLVSATLLLRSLRRSARTEEVSDCLAQSSRLQKLEELVDS